MRMEGCLQFKGVGFNNDIIAMMALSWFIAWEISNHSVYKDHILFTEVLN